MKPTHASVILALGFILLFIWKMLALDDMIVPTLGICLTAYLVITFRTRHQTKKGVPSGDIATAAPIYLLVFVVFLLILTNGGIESPLFFLLPFIAFAIAFVLPPVTVFTFTLGAVLLFLPDAGVQSMTDNLVHFGSLILLSPIAYFFGKEFKDHTAKQERDSQTADKIRSEAATILRDSADKLPEENKIQLADIIQETDDIRK